MIQLHSLIGWGIAEAGVWYKSSDEERKLNLCTIT